MIIHPISFCTCEAITDYTSPPHPHSPLNTQYSLKGILASIPLSVVPDLPLPGLTVSLPHCDPRLMHCGVLFGPTVCVVEKESYLGYFNSKSCAY